MRSRIILIVIFLLALGATFLFRGPHTESRGSSWSFQNLLDRVEDFRDSLEQILADTIEVRTACVGQGGTLGGLLYETGIEGSRYLSCCDLFIDSLGWTSVRVGDTLEAYYARDTLYEVRGKPRNRRGYFRIAFDRSAAPQEWEWVPEENYRRLRSVTLVVSSSVWESISMAGVPDDLTPTGHIVTARDSIREVAYIKNFEDQLANRLFLYLILYFFLNFSCR